MNIDDQLANLLVLNFSEITLVESSFSIMQSDLIDAELPLKVSFSYGDIDDEEIDGADLNIQIPASISFNVYKDSSSLDEDSIVLSSEYTYLINISIPSTLDNSNSKTDNTLFSFAQKFLKEDFAVFKEAITPLIWKSSAPIFNLNLVNSKIDLESLPLVFPKSQLDRIK